MTRNSVCQEVIEGRARVLDGDTVEVNGSVRVRFFGVDAPEYDQTMIKDGEELPCGQIAKEALKARIAGQPVRCEVYDTDHYGRKCAVVFNSAGEDLNAYLVSNGYVQAFTKVTRRYVELEAQAKARKLGIWSGTMQVPADYRRKKREQEAAGERPPSHQPRPPAQQAQQPQHRPPAQQAWQAPPPTQQQPSYQQEYPPLGGQQAQQPQQAQQAQQAQQPPAGEEEPHWLVKLLGALLRGCAGK